MNLMITVVRDGAAAEAEDRVAWEAPVTLFVNGEELITLLCTPARLDRLALGFLRSEGLLSARDELVSLRVREAEGVVEVELRGGTAALAEKLYGRRAVSSGCGKGTVFYSALDSLRSRPVQSDLVVAPGQLRLLMKEMKRLSVLFKATGGVHGAALAAGEDVLYFCEDIGRHNAVDKIVGECFLDQVPLEDKILLSTGRLGSEILLKAAKLGLPVLVSRAAPTSLSVELAQEMQITLIGFARGGRMNVYTHPRRVLSDREIGPASCDRK